jgi:hypothetical protein
MRYKFRLQLDKIYQLVQSTETMRTSGLLWWMLSEIFYILLHVPPRVNFVIKLDNFGRELYYK